MNDMHTDGRARVASNDAFTLQAFMMEVLAYGVAVLVALTMLTGAFLWSDNGRTEARGLVHSELGDQHVDPWPAR